MTVPQPILRVRTPQLGRSPESDALYVLDRPSVTIGRAQDQDLVLLDPCVSRIHARLDRRPEGWVVTDLGSTAGVYVDGRQCDRAVLTDGQTITIGRTTLLLVLDPHRSATVAAEVSGGAQAPGGRPRVKTLIGPFPRPRAAAHDEVTQNAPPAPRATPPTDVPTPPVARPATPPTDAPMPPVARPATPPTDAPMPPVARPATPPTPAPLLAQPQPPSHAPAARGRPEAERPNAGYELGGAEEQSHRADTSGFTWGGPDSRDARSPSFTADFSAVSSPRSEQPRRSRPALVIVYALILAVEVIAILWWLELIWLPI